MTRTGPALHPARVGTPADEVVAPAPGRRAGVRRIVLTGIAAGLAGAAAMLVWVVFCAEVADAPTPVPGISSGTWTPLTAITSFLFGVDAFHESFAVLSILFGLAAHLFLGVVFGLVGIALMTYTFAGRPTPVGGAAFGVAWALFVEVLFLNILVNGIQDLPTVYEALPSWGWWVSHGFYGATFGLVAARMLSVAAAGVTPTGRLAREAPV